jgi:hypothetical protein
VSEAVASAAGSAWRFEPRGQIEVKGQGPMNTYFLSRPAVSSVLPIAAKLDPLESTEATTVIADKNQG